ncbi:hypothetical protein C8R45DRAFT_928900 [Mycena sanguinolenta]|nr:hypothetical protein C8R45DRAFT_928900 [Mycena sanguinolenta]
MNPACYTELRLTQEEIVGSSPLDPPHNYHKRVVEDNNGAGNLRKFAGDLNIPLMVRIAQIVMRIVAPSDSPPQLESPFELKPRFQSEPYKKHYFARHRGSDSPLDSMRSATEFLAEFNRQKLSQSPIAADGSNGYSPLGLSIEELATQIATDGSNGFSPVEELATKLSDIAIGSVDALFDPNLSKLLRLPLQKRRELLLQRALKVREHLLPKALKVRRKIHPMSAPTVIGRLHRPAPALTDSCGARTLPASMNSDGPKSPFVVMGLGGPGQMFVPGTESDAVHSHSKLSI